jgi:hypothetical protein
MKFKKTACPIVARTRGPRGHFFGFHDVSPWNSNDSKVAILSFSKDIRDVPNGEQEASICIWEPAKDTCVDLDLTTTWNFQQGARLQWLPGADDNLIYNVANNGNAQARILDVNSGKSREIGMAISAVNPSGTRALAPSFARLGAHWRAYGYQRVRGISVSDPAPSEDGLWEINLETGDVKLLLAISELDGIAGRAAPEESVRFITHPSYSPSGNRVLFLERYFVPGGALYTRMYVGDPRNRNWSLVLEEMVSHFDWYDDNTILVWSRHISRRLKHSREDGLLAIKILRSLLPLFRIILTPFGKSLLKEYYAFVSVANPKRVEPFAASILKSDGHPMFRHDRKWLVTDSYPDERGQQHLYLFELGSDVVFEVGHFEADITLLSDVKCDLHPRWNRKGTQVAIDTACKGDRQLTIVDMENIVNAARP